MYIFTLGDLQLLVEKARLEIIPLEQIPDSK